MSLFQEKAENWLGEELPFVLYRKPGSIKKVGVFQREAGTFLVSDFTEKGYVFAPFDQGPKLLIPQSLSEIIMADWNDGDVSTDCELLLSDEGRGRHLELVRKAIEQVRDGRCQKIVVSRKEEMTFAGFDFMATFQHLMCSYPEAFVYCFYHPLSGLWMGAFAEQLAKIDSNRLFTMALAGTQKVQGEGDVVWAAKEKREQQLVSDAVLASLALFTEGISVGDPETVRAGTLAHIRSNISAALRSGAHNGEVITSLHPTPAVCGTPRAEALAFIREHEGYDREYYAGFHGELNHDFLTGAPFTDLYVNLRCLKAEGEKISLYVGGGITAESDPEKEWQETLHKAETMGRALVGKNRVN